MIHQPVIPHSCCGFASLSHGDQTDAGTSRSLVYDTDPAGPEAAWLVCPQRRPALHTYVNRSKIRAVYSWMKVGGASQRTGSEISVVFLPRCSRQLCTAGQTSQPGSSALHALPAQKPHSTACDWLADGGAAVAGTAGVKTEAQGRELILERMMDACSLD